MWPPLAMHCCSRMRNAAICPAAFIARAFTHSIGSPPAGCVGVVAVGVVAGVVGVVAGVVGVVPGVVAPGFAPASLCATGPVATCVGGLKVGIGASVVSGVLGAPVS